MTERQQLEERRKYARVLPPGLVDEIAEKAAEKAISKMTDHVYQEIGRGIVSKIMWLAGVVVVGLYFWLSGKGYME